MNNYKYAGATLTPGISKELILELFSGQVVQRKQIADSIVQKHLSRGGLNPKSEASQCIKAALRKMKKLGLAENAYYAHWRIAHTPEYSKTEVNESTQITQIPHAKPDQSQSTIEAITIGAGNGAVYLYYYPRDKKRARSKQIFECKVGMTESRVNVNSRVKSQSTTGIYESPEIGLIIQTNTPRELEKMIHGILEMKGRRVDTSGNGKEWFMTSPTEVAGIYTILNSI